MGAAHGEQRPLARGAAEIVALQRRVGRQHDVAMARQRIPPCLVADRRLRPAPCADQAVQILVMVERIAAGPVDQPDIGEGHARAVVVDGPAGMQQHVGQARDGNGAADRVAALGQRRPRHMLRRHADGVDRAVAEAHPAAGKADLAQHGGQHDAHPIGLFATMAPGERPGKRDDGAPRRHAAGQGAHRFGGKAGDAGGPSGVLGEAVGGARQIGQEAVETDAMGGQELAVAKPFRVERMGQPQHQRDIGVGARGEPLGLQRRVHVAAHRPHQHEFDADATAGLQPLLLRVAPGSAGAHLAVAAGQAAEGDDQLSAPGDRFPAGVAQQHLLERAQDVGHDHLARGIAVAVARGGVAADAVEEAVKLALGVMEAPGAGPAVAAGVDRRIAMGAAHAAQLAGGEVERPLPADGDEGLAPAPRAVAAGAALQPPLAHRRLADAHRIVERARHGAAQPGRIGIARGRMHGDNPAVGDLGLVGAPVAHRGRPAPPHLVRHAPRLSEDRPALVPHAAAGFNGARQMRYMTPAPPTDPPR